MRIDVDKSALQDAKTGVLIVGLFDGLALDSMIAPLDELLGKGISEMIKSKEYAPEWGKTRLIPAFGKLNAKNILIIGLGKREEFNLERLRRAAGFSAKVAREYGSVVTTSLALLDIPNTLIYDRAHAVAEGVILGLYRFDQYKTLNKDKRKEIESFHILSGSQPDKVNLAIKRAMSVCTLTNFARDLVNQPPSMMTPLQMAGMARRIADDNRLKLHVYGRDQILKMGLNGLFAVSKGSTQEPRFLVMEYRNSKAKKTIALVGKGITFDSGGLDIKPESAMIDMKDDMSGAAVVMAACAAASQLHLPINVIALMPCTENMPGGAAYKPGDIIKSHSKKTIEVQNTDAEGRLILADALSYAEKTYKPDAIIDLATLTGACVVALGRFAAGLVATDELLADRIKVAAGICGERVWQLPLYDEFKDGVKSQIADVKNLGLPKGEAGACTAAAFLSNFVEKTPWAHLDIAGPAYISDDQEYTPKGGTGFGVRLLTCLLEDWSKQ